MTDPLKAPAAANDLTGRKVYTVSELNRDIRLLMEDRFPSLWIEGEISNFKRHSASGHMYFTLKDEQSQVGAVFFSRLNQSLKFDLENGLKVLVLGKVSVYEPRGQYQIYVQRIEPKGVGALQLAFLQLKEKLEKEGLFDPSHKKSIPKFPGVVGVVTSPTGAAIRDILNVVHRRFSGTRILLDPVRVQGEGAAEEIARAVREMNSFADIDVLIVGRGGGSLEDLWAFNEETVARAVYDSRIPVISAVGHEIDWTICDLVADLRAPTPSAAAEIVVQSRDELEKRLLDYRMRSRGAMTLLIKGFRRELKSLESSYALKQPQNLVLQYVQRLDEIVRQFQNYGKALMTEKGHRLGELAGRLNALSPLAILDRGYSLTYDGEGNLLKDASVLRTGASITTRVSRGRIESEVKKIIKGEEIN